MKKKMLLVIICSPVAVTYMTLIRHFVCRSSSILNSYRHIGSSKRSMVHWPAWEAGYLRRLIYITILRLPYDGQYISRYLDSTQAYITIVCKMIT